MKVILKDEVKNVGKLGEEVKVADGFGRNYLLPRGLAVMATVQNVKKRDQEMKIKKERLDKIKNEALDLAKRLEETPCIIEAKAGEENRLFGAITTNAIANFYFKKGFQVDKKKISLEQSIKQLGTYGSTIKLHPEVVAQVKVEVVREK